tara:strand:- start:551 stop:766 length:216 start_codon:yes stop_codon:yes gene_type:complete
MEIKSGELAHIPASTILKKFAKDDTLTEVQCWAVTKVPRTLLVVEQKKNYYKVLYEGESWFVEKNEAFSME